MKLRPVVLAVLALTVLVVELGATLGSVLGEPFSPVPGWGPTRATDWLAFTAVVFGCGALAFLTRFPLAAAAVATASYAAFALRDYELGMFLPPMVAIFVLVATGRSRAVAALCAVVSLSVGMLWVGQRVGTIADPGATLLAWVAFGTVLAVFFGAPYLIGELVRLRSVVRAAGPSVP